jgi:4-amino-4-deoxy-L-arabinose transferase-like glycosyltransferase
MALLGAREAVLPAGLPDVKPKPRDLLIAAGVVLLVNATVALLAADGVILNDAESYVLLGRHLAANQGYVFEAGRVPTSWRAPGYPVFLGLLFWLSSGSLLVARLAQAGLSTASAALAWRLARRQLGEREALWTGTLVGLYPELAGFSGMLWSESLFLVLFLAALLLILNAIMDVRGRVWALAAGLVLGLAILTRSTSVVLLPVLAFAVRLAHARRLAARRALTVAVVALAITGSWSARNYLVHGRFMLVESNATFNLFVGNNPLTPTPFAWRAVEICAQNGCFADMDGLSEAESYSQIGKRARDYISGHLGLTALRALGKGMDFWLPDFFVARNMSRGVLGSWLTPIWPGFLALTVTCYLLTMVAGLRGLWRARASREGQLCFLVLVLYTLPHCLVYGASRYHVPLLPLLILFATPDLREWSVALWRGLRKIIVRPRRSPAAEGSERDRSAGSTA